LDIGSVTVKAPKTLRVRLVLWSVALEAVLLLAFAIALTLSLRDVQQRSINESLHLAASQLNSAIDVQGTNFVLPSADMATLQAEGISAWVLNEQGEVVTTTGIAGQYPLPNVLPDPLATLDARLPDDEPIRLYRAPLQEGNRVLGSIVLAASLREAQLLQQRYIYGLLILIPTLLALSAAGGLFLANRALASVTKITRLAQQIGAEDLSQRLNLDLANDEIGQLARTFDTMLIRLEQAFLREQQLTADVSHELRTPLGLLKTQMSLARSKSRDTATLLQMIASMEADVDRLTYIVEQTLLLAQIEQQGIVAPNFVYLDAVLLSVRDRLETKALEKGILLRLELLPHINWEIQGDAFYLEQVFTNILQNAIAYSPVGEEVIVSAHRNWQQVTVTVTDSGPGILPEHMTHLFERYYRVDSARTRSSGGFGLGLAIAKTIVVAHVGTITVESTIGVGTTFTVNLPASSASM
jgi:signal transduction histidine kinase